MSWLSSFWKHNRDFIGNAMKNIAPAAFLLPGAGPGVAALIGGLGSAVGRGIQHGANFGNIAKQGLQGAAMAYGGSRLTDPTGKGDALQHLKSLFGGGGGGTAAGDAASDAAGGGFTPSSSASGASNVVNTARSSVTGGVKGAGGGNQSFLSGLGSWANKNPTAAGMALQGLGASATALSNQGMNAAEKRRIDLANQESEYEIEARKRRDIAMAPLYAMFQGQLRDQLANPYSVARNPYLG